MAHDDGGRVLSVADPELRLVPDRLDSPTGLALVAEVQAEYVQRYGGPDPDDLDADELVPPHGIFLVAWFGDDVAGCGAVRRFAEDPAAGELKRMYTRATARRRGVARALLTALEVHAVELGFHRLVLETGVLQPEAIAMYEGAGYTPIAPFGPYAGHPTSRCFGKDLADG